MFLEIKHRSEHGTELRVRIGRYLCLIEMNQQIYAVALPAVMRQIGDQTNWYGSLRGKGTALIRIRGDFGNDGRPIPACKLSKRLLTFLKKKRMHLVPDDVIKHLNSPDSHERLKHWAYCVMI